MNLQQINTVLSSAISVTPSTRCEAITFNARNRTLVGWFRSLDTEGIAYLKDYFKAFCITFVALS